MMDAYQGTVSMHRVSFVIKKNCGFLRNVLEINLMGENGKSEIYFENLLKFGKLLRGTKQL